MSKRSGHRVNRSRAIERTLLRLGLHASTTQVVEALARFGIHVSEGLVHRVKLELVKDTAGVRRQLAKVPKVKPFVHGPRKVRPRHGQRR